MAGCGKCNICPMVARIRAGEARIDALDAAVKPDKLEHQFALEYIEALIVQLHDARLTVKPDTLEQYDAYAAPLFDRATSLKAQEQLGIGHAIGLSFDATTEAAPKGVQDLQVQLIRAFVSTFEVPEGLRNVLGVAADVRKNLTNYYAILQKAARVNRLIVY